MLVNISVRNFRSFNDTETFSMEAGKARNYVERTARIPNSKLLKFKAVYGSNSSGKSNLVKVFDFMQTAILRGIPNSASNDYCRINEENIVRPSLFQVVLVLNGIRYRYGFEVLLNEGRFIREWLYEQKAQKERHIFIRDLSDETCDISTSGLNASLRDRLKIYADDIKSDGSILFLRAMNQNKDALYTDNSKLKVFKDLFLWFRRNLSVNYPDEPITQYTYFFDSKGTAAAEEILSRLDTGISKVSVYDEPTEKVMSQFSKEFAQSLIDNLNDQRIRYIKNQVDKIPAIVVRSQEGHAMYLIELHGEDVICKTLKFNHKHGNALYSLRDESDGTVRLLDLIEVLLTNEENTVFIIDEMNRCLHPLITKQFVKDYLALAIERNIQLIVTTHETSLMDLELLRQDEIGFVEKRDSDGSSRIFSLDDFGTRFDKRIRNAYMRGDYEAVPKVECLLKQQQ